MKILLILAIFAFVSCATEKPKHFFYGKWESTYENTKETLRFGEDNFLQTATFGEDDKPHSKESYRFVIIDDKTVKMIYPAGAEYKVRIEARAINDDEIWIECTSQRSAEGRAIIDYPSVCLFKRLKRVKE